MGQVCCVGRDADKDDSSGFPSPHKHRGVSAGGPGRPRLLIMFDFDQTITVFHVFKTLAGWQDAPGMAGRGASTELGQLRLIAELDREEAYASQGGFSKAALGGGDRLERLRWCFLELRKLGCTLVIATKGLVGPTRRVLRDTRLLEFFDEVYGRTDEAYEECCTDYDHTVGSAPPPTQEEMQLLSKTVNVDWDTKVSLLARLQAREHAGPDETFLVEDDEQEIHNCSSIAKTLFVSEARGMPDDHLVKLMSAARGGQMTSNTHEATSWKVGDRVAIWCSKQNAWFSDGYVCEVNGEYVEVLYNASRKSEKVPHGKAADRIRAHDFAVRSRRAAPENDGMLRVLGMTCTACSAKPRRAARDLEVRKNADPCLSPFGA